MERPYIWFHTGLAFTAFAIGVILATVAALAVMLVSSEITWVQMVLVFVTFAIGLLPAFFVERWNLSRSRQHRVDPSRPVG